MIRISAKVGTPNALVSSSTPVEDNAIVRYDGVGGEDVQDSPINIEDSGNIQRNASGPQELFTDANTSSLELGKSDIDVSIVSDNLVLGAAGAAVDIQADDVIVGDGGAGTSASIPAETINIGLPGSIVNIQGTTAYQDVTNLQVTDKLITVNKGGAAASGVGSGIEIEENAIITGYVKTSADRNSLEIKNPNQTGIASITTDGDSFTVDKTIAKGPTTSSDNRLVRMDGTTGRLIQQSGIVVDDSDNVTNINDLTATGTISGGDLSVTNLDATNITLDNDNGVVKAVAGALSASALVNADVDAAAAIAESKLALDVATATLNTNINNHIADAADAHDASAISVVPTGNLAADDVQEALEELQADIDAISSGDVADLVTLSGVVAGATDLGTFTGTTIPDSSTNKAAMQALETSVETKTTGAASSTDNAVARFDSTTGKVIQNSGVIIDDSDAITGVSQMTVGSTLILSASAIATSAGTPNLSVTPNGNVNLNKNSVFAREITKTLADDSGTTSTLTQPLTSVVRITSGSRTSLDMITSPVSGRTLTVINATGNNVTINNDTGATTANRIKTGTGAAVDFPDESVFNFIYDDTEQRWMLSGGTGSGSGVGGINYIDNSDFETDINNWTGDTNLVLAHETAAPLRGTGSLKITKGAVDASTQSITSDTFTLDSADLAKQLVISFDYDFSDADYADDDAKVRVIQDPAGTPVTIEVNGAGIKAGKGTHYTRFQTDSTETDYALEIYWEDTGTAQVIAYIDNVIVGPKEIAYGTPSVNGITFTATGGWNDGSQTYTGSYDRLANKAIIQFKCLETGTPPAATNFYFDVPSNLNVDTSALFDEASNGAIYVVGSGHVFDTSASARYPVVVYYDKLNDIFVPKVINAAGTYGVEAFITSAVPMTFAANDAIICTVEVPILGWNNTSAMSSDLGQRNVILSLIDADPTSAAFDGTTNLIFASTSDYYKDTTGSYNATTGIWTCPESGWYDIKGSANVGGTEASNDSVILGVLVNGSTLARGLERISNTALASNYVDVQVPLLLTAGDQVSLRIAATLASPSISTGNGAVHKFSIVKLASPQTIFETEREHARYTSNAGATVTAGSPIIFEDLVVDSHGSYNSATGIYTAASSGLRAGHAKIKPSASSTVELGVELDGSEITVVEAGTTANSVIIPFQTYMNKGQTLEITNSAAGSLTLNSTTANNEFVIRLVK
jgi:hypothetical protein